MKEIGELCRSRKVFFHTDAAQVDPTSGAISLSGLHLNSRMSGRIYENLRASKHG